MTPAKFAKKERVDIVVRSARAGTVFSHSVGDVVVALADERDAMAAENGRLRERNAKLVALVEGHDCDGYYTGVAFLDERDALLAEIKAGA